MKKYLFMLLLAVAGFGGKSQVVISPGAQWVNNGNVMVTLQDLSLVNNGVFTAGNSTLRFTGNLSGSIGGSSATSLYALEIGKTGNNTVSLLSPVYVSHKVGFLSGLLNLNQQNLVLASNAFLENENETSRIIGPDGGEVMITVDMNSPNNLNAGNLGAAISTGTNLGAVTIKRGHQPRSGAGLTNGIHRYYSIQPATKDYIATLRYRYFNTELNGLAENSLVLFNSADNGTNWSNQSYSSRDVNANWVEKSNLTDFSYITLGADNVPPPAAGVTGLVFTANRKKPTEVQLNWSTQAEINMNGYEVQRRLSTEADFSVRSFVNSKAPGGNSATQLSYNYLDVNSHTDTSYYRLRIVDNNGNFTFSAVRAVAAKTKGGGGNGGGNGNGNGNNREAEDAAAGKKETMAFEKNAMIAVGPNPNNGNFWFSVIGIGEPTTAVLYTIDGKILKQFTVINQQQQKVHGLGTGIYLLKVPGLDAFKVIVQGSGTNTNKNPSNNQPVKF